MYLLTKFFRRVYNTYTLLLVEVYLYTVKILQNLKKKKWRYWYSVLIFRTFTIFTLNTGKIHFCYIFPKILFYLRIVVVHVKTILPYSHIAFSVQSVVSGRAPRHHCDRHRQHTRVCCASANNRRQYLFPSFAE